MTPTRSWSSWMRLTTTMRWSSSLISTTLIVLLLSGCGESSSSIVDGKLLTGTWGGENAGLLLDDTVAHVHVGCTNGDFHAPLFVSADGSVHASGSYQIRAYPIAIGPMVPAELTGKLDGSTLTFTIVANDTTQGKSVTFGPSVVRYKVEPRMGPCPICRIRPRR